MFQLYILLFIVILVSCTAPKKVVLVPSQLSLEKPVHDSIKVQKFFPDTLPDLSSDQWITSRFLVLEKPFLFRRYGYELVRCPDTALCESSLDTNLELPNRRVRYDRFVGDTLEVTGVKRDSSEWVITFTDLRCSRILHAQTHKHALKDLLLLRDLDAARKRWLGKTVYSRKGIISMVGENGSLSSKKVSRLDSLRVIDVRSGLTPLPVNPIWLMVQTNRGVNGLIPVRISWTNTMLDQVFKGVAWEDDIYETDPALLYHWDRAIWETIDNNRVTMNMSREQVFMSWGRALQKNQKAYNGTMFECWTYNTQELYFSDSGLTAIQEIISK